MVTPQLLNMCSDTISIEENEMDKEFKIIFAVVGTFIIIGAIYFAVIPFSKAYNKVDITPSPNNPNAQYCTFTFSGGQFLWYHSIYWGNSQDGSDVGTSFNSINPSTSDYLKIAGAWAQVYGRQGESITVTITYYNASYLDVSNDGISARNLQWITVSKDTAQITIP
jgi:hypothetical protein